MREERLGGGGERTMSFLEYEVGRTSLALAVLSSNRGTIAIALTSFAHPNWT